MGRITLHVSPERLVRARVDVVNEASHTVADGRGLITVSRSGEARPSTPSNSMALPGIRAAGAGGSCHRGGGAPTGIHWTFSPVLCIARDLRWGRGRTRRGPVPDRELRPQWSAGKGRGLADTRRFATAKHFVGYSETQGGRDASEADLTRGNPGLAPPPFERAEGGLLHARSAIRRSTAFPSQ